MCVLKISFLFPSRTNYLYCNSILLKSKDKNISLEVPEELSLHLKCCRDNYMADAKHDIQNG